jgi:hypothetical protein
MGPMLRRGPVLLLLAGCPMPGKPDPGTPADSGTAGSPADTVEPDSGATDHPTDTGIAYPPTPDCILEEPWPTAAEGASDWAWTMSVPDIIDWTTIHAELHQDLPCVTGEIYESTWVEGPCAGPEGSVSGTMAWLVDGDATDVTFEAFEVDWDDFDAVGDGRMAWAVEEDVAFESDVEVAVWGMSSRDAHLRQRSTYSCAGDTCTLDAYVHVYEAAESPTGDYCLTSAYTPSEACPEEGDGREILVGDHVVVTTWSSADCDGCGDVTIDGAPAGTACD